MSKLVEDRYREKVRKLLLLPGNNVCMDCHRRNPTFVCMQYKTFVCEVCADVHRNYGHTGVKTISFSVFSKEDVEHMASGGNLEAEKILFSSGVARADQVKPNETKFKSLADFKNACDKYIQRVYAQRGFMARGGAGQQQQQKSEEEIQRTLHDISFGMKSQQPQQMPKVRSRSHKDDLAQYQTVSSGNIITDRNIAAVNNNGYVEPQQQQQQPQYVQQRQQQPQQQQQPNYQQRTNSLLGMFDSTQPQPQQQYSQQQPYAQQQQYSQQQHYPQQYSQQQYQQYAPQQQQYQQQPSQQQQQQQQQFYSQQQYSVPQQQQQQPMNTGYARPSPSPVQPAQKQQQTQQYQQYAPPQQQQQYYQQQPPQQQYQQYAPQQQQYRQSESVNPFDDDLTSSSSRNSQQYQQNNMDQMYSSFQNMSVQPTQNYANQPRDAPLARGSSFTATTTSSLPPKSFTNGNAGVSVPPVVNVTQPVPPLSSSQPVSSAPAPPPMPASGVLKTSPRANLPSASTQPKATAQQPKSTPQQPSAGFVLPRPDQAPKLRPVSTTTATTATTNAVPTLKPTTATGTTTPVVQNTRISPRLGLNPTPKPQQGITVSSEGGEAAKEAEKIDDATWDMAEKSKKTGVDIDTLRGATALDNGKFKKVNANFAPMKQSSTWE